MTLSRLAPQGSCNVGVQKLNDPCRSTSARHFPRYLTARKIDRGERAGLDRCILQKKGLKKKDGHVPQREKGLPNDQRYT